MWLLSYINAKAEYEVLTKNNIPVMVMESIRGGRLSNLSDKVNKMLLDACSISSWALRFLKTLPQVILSGMSHCLQSINIPSLMEELNGLLK